MNKEYPVNGRTKMANFELGRAGNKKNYSFN